MLPLTLDFGSLLHAQLRSDHFAGHDDFHTAIQLAPSRCGVVCNGVFLPHSFRRDGVGREPSEIKNSRTVSARCCDSFMLKSAVPVMSVWPSIARFSPG